MTANQHLCVPCFPLARDKSTGALINMMYPDGSSDIALESLDSFHVPLQLHEALSLRSGDFHEMKGNASLSHPNICCL